MLAIAASMLLVGCSAVPVSGGSTGGAVSAPASLPMTQSASAEPTGAPVAIEPTETPLVRLPVFVYHHVKPTANNYIAITPATFEAHLKALKRLGYTAITARELSSSLANGEPLPDKPVMLTFDDGWSNQYDYAVPLLEKYGMHATFFLYPKVLHGGSFMTRAQVSKLAAAGHDMETHTWGHSPVQARSKETTDAFVARVDKMLEPAADWIVDAAGREPVAFAYPYGYYDSRSPGVLPLVGLEMAFTVDDGVNELGNTSPLLFKRFTVFKKDSVADFEERLSSRTLALDGFAPANGVVIKGPDVDLEATLGTQEAAVTDLRFVVDTESVPTSVSVINGHTTVAATCQLKDGFHYVTLTGADTDGTRAYASWGVNTR